VSIAVPSGNALAKMVRRWACVERGGGSTHDSRRTYLGHAGDSRRSTPRYSIYGLPCSRDSFDQRLRRRVLSSTSCGPRVTWHSSCQLSRLRTVACALSSGGAGGGAIGKRLRLSGGGSHRARRLSSVSLRCGRPWMRRAAEGLGRRVRQDLGRWA
jgi:hypothetical protein